MRSSIRDVFSTRVAACVMHVFDDAEPAAAFLHGVPPNRMCGTTRVLWRPTKDRGRSDALVPAMEAARSALTPACGLDADHCAARIANRMRLSAAAGAVPRLPVRSVHFPLLPGAGG